MYNIYQAYKPNDGYSFQQFEKEFIKICNDHIESKKALFFAFIIYDFTSPEVSKVLHDDDYWKSLNKISGDKISIFHIHKYTISECRNDKEHRGMYNVYNNTDIDPINSQLKITDSYFPKGIQSPSILFFQVNNEKVIDQFHIDIKEELQEKVYLEIKRYIKNAVKSISHVTESNRYNHQEIFNLVFDDFKKRRGCNVMFSRIKNSIEYISFIKGLMDLIHQ